MNTRTKEDARRLELAKSLGEWKRICEMLELGDYEQAAECLSEAQTSCEKLGHRILAEILAATRQICLACSQFRAEIVWHRQAEEGAHERELELKHQLYLMLEMARSTFQDVPPLPSVSKTPRGNRSRGAGNSSENDFSNIISKGEPDRKFWQRLQNLLTEWSASQPSKTRRLEGDPELVEIALENQQEKTEVSVGIEEEQRWSNQKLIVQCLGTFRVLRNGQLISNWHSLKGQTILKYLINQHRNPVSKEVLMEVFWPDADPESARRNLHQAIYSLRQTLKQGKPDFQPILFENDSYTFNLGISLWIDFEEFEQHAQAGQRLELAGCMAEAAAEYNLAEELYRGDFLEEDPYEDWTNVPREQLRNIYLDLADRLSEYHRLQDNDDRAIELSQKILLKDNCHEQAHRRLMQCYQKQGKRSLVVRQYRLCAETLKNELDVSPSAETQNLFEKIVGCGKGVLGSGF